MRAEYRSPSKLGEYILVMSYDEINDLKFVLGPMAKAFGGGIISQVYDILCEGADNELGASVKIGGEQKNKSEPRNALPENVAKPGGRYKFRGKRNRPFDIERARKLYLAGLTATKIAREMKEHPSFVNHRLTVAGVEFRPRGGNHGAK